ncbi:MAG: hypothetical protein DMD58_11045 [Gemmatimonadetes bacterium]|nr:MAG: hypothetical protein DMD58_11045 [Gemmatimonadota bacterium]
MTSVGPIGYGRHQREQLCDRDRLAAGPGRQRDGSVQQPRGQEPQHRQDVAQQHPDQLIPGEQPATRDRHERDCHEELIDDGIEHGAGARRSEPARHEAVGDVAPCRSSDNHELPRGRAHERKDDGERQAQRRQGIGYRKARFHPTLASVDVKLLKQAAIFQDLDEGELARVTEVCREQKFTVGQYVFKEGEPGNRLFLISEGEVRISRTIPGSGEEALAVLKPGSCFGEMSIFDRSERSTDAIANTTCTLITISRSDFELLLDFNRDVAYKILWSVVRLLSARLRVTNDNLRSFLAMSMF